jgi:NAD(P)H-dependent FMN reductase
MLRVGVVIGTTRSARFGDKPAFWIHDLAAARPDLSPELLDLRDYALPFFADDRSPMYGPSPDPAVQAWAAKLDSADALIVVTGEYNHGPPAVLKNAFDCLYPEVARKPVAFVGYGGVGAARAIEQMRLCLIEMQMAPIRSAVHIAGADFLRALREGAPLASFANLATAAGAMLDELSWWATALKAARRGTPPHLS